jgi:hypothetical protein
MTIIIPLPSILAGLLAGALYTALHHGWIVGVTAPFLPIFVLALSGMRYGRAGISVACLATLPTILMTLPFNDAAFIIVGQLMPMTLFIRTLMVAVWIREPPILLWSSIGIAVAALSAYGAALFAMLVVMNDGLYSHLTASMQTAITASFTTMEPEMAAMMEGLVKKIPHILLAIDFWIWSVMLYVVVMLANGLVHSMGYGRRPPLRLTLHSPPNWILGALVVALLLSVIAPAPLMQGAQAACVILLLPYFFSGLSYAHMRLRSLPRSNAWMVGFYLLFIVLSLWPVIMVILFALGRHVRLYAFFNTRSPKDTK